MKKQSNSLSPLFFNNIFLSITKTENIINALSSKYQHYVGKGLIKFKKLKTND